jgi:hypothetical protein
LKLEEGEAAIGIVKALQVSPALEEEFVMFDKTAERQGLYLDRLNSSILTVPQQVLLARVS